jgi:hypothetical protein
MLKAEAVENKDRGSGSFGARCLGQTKEDGGVACKPRFFDSQAGTWCTLSRPSRRANEAYIHVARSTDAFCRLQSQGHVTSTRCQLLCRQN